MARQPMVTRTITITKARVLCLNLETREPIEKIVDVSRTFKDSKKLMRKVEEIVNSDTMKAVKILSIDIEQILYGMTEQKFIETAEILPDRK